MPAEPDGGAGLGRNCAARAAFELVGARQSLARESGK